MGWSLGRLTETNGQVEGRLSSAAEAARNILDTPDVDAAQQKIQGAVQAVLDTIQELRRRFNYNDARIQGLFSQHVAPILQKALEKNIAIELPKSGPGELHWIDMLPKSVE